MRARGPSPCRRRRLVEALPASRRGPGDTRQARRTERFQPATTAAEGKPFFKTTTGIVSLVLLGGALGYMAYSFSNGRVKSPAK